MGNMGVTWACNVGNMWQPGILAQGRFDRSRGAEQEIEGISADEYFNGTYCLVFKKDKRS